MKKFTISFLSLVIFTLCVISFILIMTGKDMIKNSRIIFQVSDYLNFQISNNLAFENTMAEIITKLSKDKEISPKTESQIQKKLCTYKIEYGIDAVQVSDAYLCLAKLDIEASNSLYAIKNTSYSIDLYTNIENSNYLKNLIIGNDKEEVSEVLQRKSITLSDWDNKNITQEIEILNEIAKSQNKNLSARANYRLSLIYSLGRTNSEADRNIDITKAFDHQKIASNQINVSQPKNTDIALVINDKYAQYAATTITSILLNSDLDNHYNFYVIYDNKDPILPETQKKLASISKIKDFDIKFIEFPENLIEENKELLEHLPKNKRYPRLVFFRILLGKLLPNLDKILVTDVDILVYRDLHDLTNTKLDGYLIGAVVDPHNIVNGMLARKSNCEGLPPEYFNVGVMLQNLKLMREEDIYSKFLRTNKKFVCDNTFPEQDNLNITAAKRALFLSPRWNMIPIIDSFDGIYPNGFMPFIIHHANKKPYDKLFVKRVKNNEKIPEHISTYYIYNEYAKQFLKE